MRWPSPRAQTAQPERWRMRRWSREPRRKSVVEGSLVASLARAARVLSVCFIYIHETIKEGPCQEFSKHFYEILFCSIRRPIAAHRSLRPVGKDEAHLSVASHVSRDPSSSLSEQGTDSLPFRKIPQLQSMTPEQPINHHESVTYGFRDRN